MRPPLLVECRVKCEQQWCCSKPGRRYTAAVPFYDCWVKLVDTSGLGSLTVAVLCSGDGLCDTTVIQSLSLSFQTKQRSHSSTWALSRLPALCDKEIKWKRRIGKDRNAINVIHVDDILLRYSPDWFRNAVQPFNMFSLEAQIRNGCLEC